MTPDEREQIWEPNPPPKTRARQRHERRLAARSQPGGITRRCGCRFTRTGHEWLHLTPCRKHQLLQHPIADERMKEIL
jgi:hypothetical protein